MVRGPAGNIASLGTCKPEGAAARCSRLGLTKVTRTHAVSAHQLSECGKQAWTALAITFLKQRFIHSFSQIFLSTYLPIYSEPDMVLGSADTLESI